MPASHPQARTMRFIPLDPPSVDFAKPCQVCVSHALNADGYLYKTWAVDGRKVKEPFYRFLFRALRGWELWPEGLEADHICGFRACVEPTHIRAIGRSDHKSVTNFLRYADRNEEARLHWLVTGCTGTALAGLFGVTISTGCRWVRRWTAYPDE